MVKGLTGEAVVHNTGSAGDQVMYLPEDHPEVAVLINDEGYSIFDRKSDTGDIWKDVPASYMDPKTSEPYQPKISEDF